MQEIFSDDTKNSRGNRFLQSKKRCELKRVEIEFVKKMDIQITR